MKAPSRVRKQVRERDGNQCLLCGEDDIELLTVDHIIPTSRGGSRCDMDNLQTLCKRCNCMKGNSLPTDLPSDVGKLLANGTRIHGIWPNALRLPEESFNQILYLEQAA